MRTLVALFLIIPTSLYSQDWINVDARSKGLGNAGVAISEGPSASYYNPANLAKGAKTMWEFWEAGFGFNVSVFSDVTIEGGVLSKADQVIDLFNSVDLSGIQTRLNAGTATATDIRNALRVVNEITSLAKDEIAVIGQGGYAVDIKAGSFGFFYRQLGYATIVPTFDLSFSGASALADGGFAEVFNTIGTGNVPATTSGSNLSTALQNVGLTVAQANELAFQAEQALGSTLADPTIQDAIKNVAGATVSNAGGSSTNTILNNNSGIKFTGVLLKEVGISVGVPLPIGFNGGIAVKQVTGETFVVDVKMKDIVDGTDIFKDLTDKFDDNTKTTSKFNLDVGAGFSLLGLNAGVVYKNVLPMEFDVKGGGDFRVKPQLRGGVSFAPLGLIKLAADIDLLENRVSSIKDFRSRMLGAGVEVDPGFLFKFRLGGFDNIASSKTGMTYTGGLGAGLGPLYLDLNGQISTGKEKIESANGTTSSKKVPERVGLALNFGFNLKF